MQYKYQQHNHDNIMTLLNYNIGTFTTLSEP